MSKGGFKKDIMDKIDGKSIEVRRVGRDIAKWWNERRRPDDVRMFCGWFWICGNQEGGPFPTPSAAYRDAYYRFVLVRDPPSALPVNVVPIRRRRA